MFIWIQASLVSPYSDINIYAIIFIIYFVGISFNQYIYIEVRITSVALLPDIAFKMSIFFIPAVYHNLSLLFAL